VTLDSARLVPLQNISHTYAVVRGGDLWTRWPQRLSYSHYWGFALGLITFIILHIAKQLIGFFFFSFRPHALAEHDTEAAALCVPAGCEITLCF
jgi:hypothetical protein